MKKFTPFSDDIIFFDAEFTDLDIKRGELMSIGMITLDGSRELYLELEYDEGTMSDWVRENVVPHLSAQTVARDVARELIRDICGSSEPHLVATVNQWDMAFWHKLFAGEEEPINRIPIDFASILFGMGLNPARTINDEKEDFYASFGIDLSDYKMHNALDDAKLMRDLYVRLTTNNELDTNIQIDKSESKVIHKDLSYKVVGLLFDVFNSMGYGYQEKYYENALAEAFSSVDMSYQRQVPCNIRYKDKKVGQYYLDFLVEDKIVLELKRGSHFAKQNIEQVQGYLKATGVQLAILANFTPDGVKFKRVLNVRDL